MSLIENLFSQILFVFQNGVFGISLVNFGIILLSLLVSLLIRGVIAKLIVNKVKK